mgnify:CR=1 FL=1
MASKQNFFFSGQDFAKAFNAQDFAKAFNAQDFTKAFSAIKSPAVDVKALMECHQKNLEAFTSAGQVALEGAQELAKRQGDMVRKGVEELSSAAADNMTVGSVEDKTVKGAEMVKSTYQSVLSNLWDLGDLASKSSTKSVGVINKRVAESLDEVKGFFPKEKASTSASA